MNKNSFLLVCLTVCGFASAALFFNSEGTAQERYRVCSPVVDCAAAIVPNVNDGGFWYGYDDRGDGGNSSVVYPVAADTYGDYVQPMVTALGMISVTLNTGALADNPVAGYGFNVVNGAKTPANVNTWGTGVCVTIQNSAALDLEMEYQGNGTLTGYNEPFYRIVAGTGPVVVDVLWANFKQQNGWGTPITGDPASAVAGFKFKFAGKKGETGTNQVKIWQFGTAGSCTLPGGVTPPAKALADSMLAWIPDAVYTGSPIEPEVVLTDGDQVLEKDVDYTLAYLNNTAIGQASILITGAGNYTGGIIGTFNIVEEIVVTELTEEMVTPIPNQTIRTAPVTPAVEVKDGTKTLIKDRDYTVTYEDNDAVGLGQAVITGQGNYSGTVTVFFVIEEFVPTVITEAMVTPIPDQFYTGAALTPAVVIKDGAKTLVKDTDYTIAYAYNTNISDTARAVISGKGDYSGILMISFKIVLKPTALTSAMLAAIPVQPYTGSPVEPALTIKDGAKTLVKDTDYTVVFTNNLNVGVATAAITGKGSYTGSFTRTFTISRANFATLTTLTIAGLADTVYTGVQIRPVPEVKHGEKVLVLTTDFTITYKMNLNAGTATVTVAGAGNYTGSVAKTFKILPRNLSDLTIEEIPDQLFTGLAKTPVPQIKHGEITLSSIDFTTAYGNNTDLGEATVTITGIGNYTGSAEATFKIVSSIGLQKSNAMPRVYARTLGNTIQLFNLPKGSTVEVFDIHGKRIYRGSAFYAPALNISVGAKGFYLVKASAQNEMRTFRVMVK